MSLHAGVMCVFSFLLLGVCMGAFLEMFKTCKQALSWGVLEIIKE